LSRSSQTLYAIGKVTKAFGIKGEVVVQPMTESVARFKKLKRVFLGRQGSETVECKIECAQTEARGVRLRFEKCTDRTSAEALVGYLLFVDEEQRIVPKKGSHFIHEVVGLVVVDEEENIVGVVKDVLRMPAQDIYVIVKDGHEWMLPAVKEFIESIDMKARRMKVRVIEGLMRP
jgi:16S rRNA processing protein RimM